MGCDIHMWAEVKKVWAQPDTKDEWITVGKVFPYAYHRKKEVSLIRKGYALNEMYSEHPYMGRNYVLFSLLANVRNYNNDIEPLFKERITKECK